jgi:glycosyltransferase involved in cell wall biosynthesis
VRILFLAWKNECHPLAGGSEVLVDRLAAGLHARGHEVTLLCAGPTGEHEYEVIDAGTKMRQYVTDPIVVRRRFRDVDVIVDVCNGLAFYSPLWARTAVVALVNHIHTGMWQEWFSPAVAWVGSTFETRVMPRVYRSKLIVAVSESTASALRLLGIPEENIRVVHNGVDLPTTIDARAPEPTFVAVGRLVPHKRFDLMLRTWARVRPETGGTLVIAGEGPLREELEADAPAGTVFLGHISDEERDALLARAWFLVQPSRLEGWGLVVMEAAACGTPTIGFRVPGTRDAVVHGESGILVEDEDELVDQWIALASDTSYRKLLSKGARQRGEAFSWYDTVDRFEEVLVEAVAAPAVAGSAVAATVARPPRVATSADTSWWPGGVRPRSCSASSCGRSTTPRRSTSGWPTRSVTDLGLPVAGQRILDLGCGAGPLHRGPSTRGRRRAPAGARRCVAARERDTAARGGAG